MKRDKIGGKDMAEEIIIPVKLTPAQKRQAATQLAQARKKSFEEMTESNKLALRLYQLKFQLEDYLDNKEFHPELTFGFFLRKYIEVLNLKRREFASNISIEEAVLSQFINSHRMPPAYVVIRLEIHSNGSIPAIYWFRLIEKQKEFELSTDMALRKRQSRFVRKKLAITV